jgi:hypothetical protein
MASGRTSYSNWLSKKDAWRLVYEHSNLISDEWIGIQEKGKGVAIIQIGPWFNPDKANGR